MQTQGQAYILHRRDYRNTSLILEVFTEKLGRASVLARGIKRHKQRQYSVQPFQSLYLDCRGQGELLTLVSLELQHVTATLSGAALFCGLYVNELILRLVPRYDADPSLFSLYEWVIKELAFAQSQSRDALQMTLRKFELSLLAQLGYGINFRLAHASQVFSMGRVYQYDLEMGCFVESAEIMGNPQSISGESVLAMQNGVYQDAKVLRESKYLMRNVIDHYLNGRRLTSRELFQ